jgi:hypothetical protein
MYNNHRKDHAPNTNYHMTTKLEKTVPASCHGEKFGNRLSYKTGKNVNNFVPSNHERNVISRASHLNISVIEYKRTYGL